MNTLLLTPVLFRLGLTLLHALWELLALGLLAWAGLALLRRHSPSTRYAFACTALAAMVMAPLLTFLLLNAGASPVLAMEGDSLRVAPFLAAGGFLWRSSVWAPWLAILWFLGAAIMMARLGGGIWWLDRAYCAQARQAPGAWQATLDRLALHMGLSRPVRLLESRRTDTPLVIGWVRPVILVPAAALLSLSPAAMEAVLAHELAHIRRLDYLANLLQCLAEALLFFHPAAWWLSRQVRELREHCCDDAAAALCGDPMILAEGLSALERLRRHISSDPEPALAAAKGKLMNRITRLFRPQDVQVPSLRGLAALLIGISLLGVTALAAQKHERPAKPSRQSATSTTDGVAEFDFSKIKVLTRPKTLEYPAEAKEKGVQGTVIVALTIDERGVPSGAKVLEGPQMLQASAVEYAKQWRFAPVKVDGKPVQARFKLAIVFKLK